MASTGKSKSVYISLGQVKINAATANDSYCSPHARRLTNLVIFSLIVFHHNGSIQHNHEMKKE